jgi:chemotaxis response regulator CheB
MKYETGGQDSPPLRVLIVDDSRFSRQILKLILRRYPNEFDVVGEAEDGATGLALFHRLHPDVISLDFDMPTMDGLEMLKQLRTKSQVPVVTVSGLAIRFLNLAKEMGLGKVESVTKDFTEESWDLSMFEQEYIYKLKKATGRVEAER